MLSLRSFRRPAPPLAGARAVLQSISHLASNLGREAADVRGPIDDRTALASARNARLAFEF